MERLVPYLDGWMDICWFIQATNLGIALSWGQIHVEALGGREGERLINLTEIRLSGPRLNEKYSFVEVSMICGMVYYSHQPLLS